jgi:hypothetical protein
MLDEQDRIANVTRDPRRMQPLLQRQAPTVLAPAQKEALEPSHSGGS